MDDYTNKTLTYDEWIDSVNATLDYFAGVSINDLPDWGYYWDAYDSGMSAGKAASMALKNAEGF